MKSNAHFLKKILVLISFLVILEPMYLSNIAGIDVIYNVMKIIDFLYKHYDPFLSSLSYIAYSPKQW